MRFTEKELARFGCSATADLEGRLNYRPPSGNFSQAGFKERWFKLKANFLFYFRINELGVIDRKEPAGVFVLEDSQIQAEVVPGIPFAFSIVFGDDTERKHVFSSRSEDQVQQWVTAIKACSYEYWRSQLRSMQGDIKRLTGQDPLLMYPHNESVALKDKQKLTSHLASVSLSPSRPARSPNRRATSFKSHIQPVESSGLQIPNMNPRPSSYNSHILPANNVAHNIFPIQNTGFMALAGTSQTQFPPSAKANQEVPIAFPSPPRPSRNANRRVANATVTEASRVATRVAPPPPIPPSTSQDLIKF